MATEVSAAPVAMPQLQSVQKALALPTVGAAVEQVGALYTRVKGAHALLEWALRSAEAGAGRAASTAAPYVAGPLAAGDAALGAALDRLQSRVPLLAEEPKVIVETTKQAVITRLSPHVNKVCTARVAAEQRVQSLKEISWTKANALLSTAYGQKAVAGVDSGAAYAMQLLDHYLPPVGPQQETTGEAVPGGEQPAARAARAVARLGAAAAIRVWANLAYKINELRSSGAELDVRRYVSALLAALHLASVTAQLPGGPQGAPPQGEPRAPAAAESTRQSAPTTANMVKSTPESKSTAA